VSGKKRKHVVIALAVRGCVVPLHRPVKVGHSSLLFARLRSYVSLSPQEFFDPARFDGRSVHSLGLAVVVLRGSPLQLLILGFWMIAMALAIELSVKQSGPAMVARLLNVPRRSWPRTRPDLLQPPSQLRTAHRRAGKNGGLLPIVWRDPLLASVRYWSCTAI